jgi:tRNA A-37 threonylcarbamoyl transferase component Bud32
MTPERWQAIGELFDGALTVATTERQDWVERTSDDRELRQEVLSLLASYNAKPGGFVQHQIKNALASFCAINPAPTQPVRVGPYRLLRELGRGGMGTVFLAERDDDQYRSQVAVKLVRTGMDTEFILARFRRERQTLARMQHPNIARLLDGGSEKGLPYIVMEYIHGLPITSHAKEKNLDIPQRLRLFANICSAVEYAHRLFVIHRDVKPGNIIVGSDGIPKLLDFGICKLLHDEPLSAADTAANLLTPAYASPEQTSGKAVTRLSDIYSLGVVLYELLTGKLPGGAVSDRSASTQGTVAARLRPPSAVVENPADARRLSGDLDNIVMHALECEPERRYESAAHLAADLHRCLANEPVLARPQTRGYRTIKFLRRNRVKVIATTIVVLALATALIALWRQARIAHARLQDVYQAMVAQQAGDSLTAAQELQAARQAYSESANQAESCMKTGSGKNECRIIYIQSSYRLARNAVALGQREPALEFARRAFRAGETERASTTNPGIVPAASGAMGLTYAALANSPLGIPGDREQAQLWLNKSLEAWRAAESVSAPVDRQRAMREVEDALIQIKD